MTVKLFGSRGWSQEEPIMKFKIKYPTMVPLVDEIGGIIRGVESGPCCVCGELTDFVEINAEVYLCSEECEDAMYKDLPKSAT